MGLYAVYVRIPSIRATTEGAIYTINHAGQSGTVVINQAVFPNIYYVTDGWVYIGKYAFTGNGSEYIQLTNRTQDETATVSNLFVGADAVRFVFQGNTTPTPLNSSVTPTVHADSVAHTYADNYTYTDEVSNADDHAYSVEYTDAYNHAHADSDTYTDTDAHTDEYRHAFAHAYSYSNTHGDAYADQYSNADGHTYTYSNPDANLHANSTPTRTPSRTPTATRTRLPTSTPAYTLINVYFANKFRYENNLPPIEVAGKRWAHSNMLPQSALNEFFKGPGSTERYYYGWIGVYNGFTGYSKLEITNGIANVYLTGVCMSEGKDFNIADLIRFNLKQFPVIQFVKIYDEHGQTQNPNGQSDSEPICLSQIYTPPPTATPTATQTPRPSPTPLYTRVNVYFASKLRYELNAPPIERAGVRWAKSNAVYETVLNEFFKGPGATEKYSYGWIGVYNGFTGYSKLEVSNGIASVYLTGVCTSEGKDFNIADLIRLDLKQFPEIQSVKIYDEHGQTQNPTGQSDSEPVCLSQFFTPTITPTRTPTATRTATPTRTPTQTPRPSPTPLYIKVNVYFVSKFRLTNNLPPFEVAGVRWARTNNIIGTVLDAYFQGPGSTERYSYGWIAIYNGFTGYSKLEVANGVARIYLTGTCEASNSPYTIANILTYNLKQFPEIQYVKIYDQNGVTPDPFGLSDSAPRCLHP